MKAKAPANLVTNLTSALVSTMATATFLRACHWNVEGEAFFPLHEFYGAQYAQLDADADALAERLLALGNYAVPELTEVGAAIADNPKANGDPKVVTRLLELNRTALAIACETAGTAGDKVTENMVLAWLEARDKALWMLKAHCAED